MLAPAAWCFFSEDGQKPASDFVAVFGSDLVHCVPEDAFPGELKTRGILSVKAPPLYRGSHVDDIALVQLDREVLPADGAAAPPSATAPLGMTSSPASARRRGGGA